MRLNGKKEGAAGRAAMPLSVSGSDCFLGAVQGVNHDARLWLDGCIGYVSMHLKRGDVLACGQGELDPEWMRADGQGLMSTCLSRNICPC